MSCTSHLDVVHLTPRCRVPHTSMSCTSHLDVVHLTPRCRVPHTSMSYTSHLDVVLLGKIAFLNVHDCLSEYTSLLI